MTLTESVQRYIENMVQDLKGDEDFPPFFIIKDHQGTNRILAVEMPEGADAKDKVANMLAALCALHRVTEAALGAVGWMVKVDKDDLGLVVGLPPSQDPRRVEVVMLTIASVEDDSLMYTADLIRENNLVGVGLWEPSPAAADCQGRFVEAIELGISFGQMLPSEMTEFFDEELGHGREQELIAMMTRAVEQSAVFGK